MEKDETDISTPERDNEDVPDGNLLSCIRKNEKQRPKQSQGVSGHIIENVSGGRSVKRSNIKLNKSCSNSLSKMDDEYYSMDYEYNGYLLIFAHETFEFGALENRPKAEEDIVMLKESFEPLNFHISVERNRKFREIEKIIEEESSKNFDKYASFAIAISSHGSSDTIAAKDTHYTIDKIIEPFKKTQSLIGKPKMFFFGSCRGKLVDNGANLSEDAVEMDGTQVNDYTIPVEADILIVFATIDGYISYHNSENGSQFFIYLTEALNDHADTMDMLTILTKANHQLAINFSSKSSDPKRANKKQCMCFLSTLTRLLKFDVKSKEQR